jgi:hypothetical protein
VSTARRSSRLEKITAELEKRDFAGPSIRSEEELRDSKATRTAPDLIPMLRRGDTSLLLEPEENGNERKQSRHAD